MTKRQWLYHTPAKNLRVGFDLRCQDGSTTKVITFNLGDDGAATFSTDNDESHSVPGSCLVTVVSDN